MIESLRLVGRLAIVVASLQRWLLCRLIVTSRSLLSLIVTFFAPLERRTLRATLGHLAVLARLLRARLAGKAVSRGVTLP